MAYPQQGHSEIEDYYRHRGVENWQCYQRPNHPEATYVIDADYSAVNQMLGIVVTLRYVLPTEHDGVGFTVEEPRGCMCKPVPPSMLVLTPVEGEVLAACCAIDEFIHRYSPGTDGERERVILRLSYRAFTGTLTPKAHHWLYLLRLRAAEHNCEVLYRSYRTACYHRPQGEVDLNNPEITVGSILPADAPATFTPRLGGGRAARAPL